jgi:hypothetical protein
MATTYKVLGQANPASNTFTTLYTVPAATSTVVSTINVCNQGIANDTFRIAIRPGGETLVPKHYISFNTVVPAYDSISLTVGITLATTDIITVYANASTTSFNVFGSEIS